MANVKRFDRQVTTNIPQVCRATKQTAPAQDPVKAVSRRLWSSPDSPPSLRCPLIAEGFLVRPRLAHRGSLRRRRGWPGRTHRSALPVQAALASQPRLRQIE
jgi:hypothetical protein